jgi:hypothetical protein
MSERARKKRYVLCVSNNNYPASLEVRKIYQHIPDLKAESHGQIRVIDESGEDYLFPSDLFIAIEVPQEAARVFAHGS